MCETSISGKSEKIESRGKPIVSFENFVKSSDSILMQETEHLLSEKSGIE